MTIFTNNGSATTYDIVHMSGKKDIYDITENAGILTYTGSSHTYIVGTEVEQLGFNFVDGSGNDAFKRDVEYSLIAVDPNTILLLHGEDFTDSSSNSHTVSNTGVVISESGKFGSAFDFTSNKRLTAPASVSPTSVDWTIDFWINARSISGYNRIITNAPSNIVCPIALYLSAGTFRLNYSTNGSTWTETNLRIGNATLNTWTHFALTYATTGSVFRSYVDGIFSGQVSTSGGLAVVSEPLHIGSMGDGSYGLDGMMDEIRISNNVRWTENFTPPTNSYTN